MYGTLIILRRNRDVLKVTYFTGSDGEMCDASSVGEVAPAWLCADERLLTD